MFTAVFYGNEKKLKLIRKSRKFYHNLPYITLFFIDGLLKTVYYGTSFAEDDNDCGRHLLKVSFEAAD